MTLTTRMIHGYRRTCSGRQTSGMGFVIGVSLGKAISCRKRGRTVPLGWFDGQSAGQGSLNSGPQAH